MSEPSFASLSPTLLARKGGARPAMRPQHAAFASIPAAPAPEALEDLGWNDMGDEGGEAPTAEVVALTPAPRNPDAEAPTAAAIAAARPAVLRQQDAIVQRIADSKPVRAVPAKGAARRAAFTLRLDAERHLKLKLACTIRDCSAQTLVTEALDALLGDLAGLDTLAAQVKRR